jgi:hypothetical protein
MIKATSIKPGDRVAVKAHGHSVTRTVSAVGDNYVTIHIAGQEAKVPEHMITSHISVGKPI